MIKYRGRDADNIKKPFNPLTSSPFNVIGPEPPAIIKTEPTIKNNIEKPILLKIEILYKSLNERDVINSFDFIILVR